MEGLKIVFIAFIVLSIIAWGVAKSLISNGIKNFFFGLIFFAFVIMGGVLGFQMGSFIEELPYNGVSTSWILLNSPVKFTEIVDVSTSESGPERQKEICISGNYVLASSKFVTPNGKNLPAFLIMPTIMSIGLTSKREKIAQRISKAIPKNFLRKLLNVPLSFFLKEAEVKAHILPY